jgi:hypothetical protein
VVAWEAGNLSLGEVMSEGGPGPFDAGSAQVDRRPEVDRTEALRERIFGSAIAALELYTIYLGERLGLYRALAEGGPASSSQLADRTGTAERYVREWLEQHAASGLIDVDDPRADPLLRRYRLPPEHIPVLADPDDVRYEAHTGVDIVRAGRQLPQLVEAFRGRERAATASMGARGPGRGQPRPVHQPARQPMAPRDC